MEKYLQDSTSEFEVSARRAIECMLGQSTFSPRNFKVSSAVMKKSAITCSIRTSSPHYNIMLSVGIEGEDLNRFLPKLTQEEQKLDAMGEITNVIAGNLIGKPVFSSRFGCMKMSVPSFIPVQEDSNSALCVSGVLITDQVRVSLNLVVESNGKGD